MSGKNGSGDDTRKAWVVAAVGGLVALVFLMAVADWGAFGALVVAFVVFLGLGAFLKRRAGGESAAAPTAPQQPVSGPAPAAASEPAAAPEPSPEPASPVAVDEPMIKPSAPLAGEAELAARKGSWTYSGDASDPVADVAQQPRAEPGPEAVLAAEPAPVVPSPENTGPRVLPSTPLAGEAELAARKGTWSYTAPGA